MTGRWIIGAAATLLGVAGGAGALGAVIAGPDVSAAVSAPRIGATGTGLHATIGGHDLVAATSSVSAGIGGAVQATAAGELTPGAVAVQQAVAPSPGSSESHPKQCAQPQAAFPAPFATALSLGIACSTVDASQSAAGTPGASATGAVTSLGVAPPAGSTPSSALGSLLPTQVVQTSPLASQLSSLLGTLPAIPSGGLPAGSVVSQAVSAATGSGVTSLISAALGPSTSSITTSGSVVSATSTDTGSTVSLLAGAGAGGGPLLTVHVGRAVVAVHVDRATGAVTESATGSAVTVTVTPPTGTAHSVAVTPGASQSFFTGTPLQTTVSVGAPTTTTGAGSVTASGVTIDLAEGAGATTPRGVNGGVVLVLGQAGAHASGTARPVATPDAAGGPAAPTAAPGGGGSTGVLTGATTVHTGEPWSGPLPIVMLSMSLLAGLGLIARRRLVPLAHIAARITGHVAAGARAGHPSAGPGLRDLLRSPSGSETGPAASFHPRAGRGDG